METKKNAITTEEEEMTKRHLKNTEFIKVGLSLLRKQEHGKIFFRNERISSTRKATAT